VKFPAPARMTFRHCFVDSTNPPSPQPSSCDFAIHNSYFFFELGRRYCRCCTRCGAAAAHVAETSAKKSLPLQDLRQSRPGSRARRSRSSSVFLRFPCVFRGSSEEGSEGGARRYLRSCVVLQNSLPASRVRVPDYATRSASSSPRAGDARNRTRGSSERVRLFCVASIRRRGADALQSFWQGPTT